MAVLDNVFRGPHSVAEYFNPESNPPLPLVEIPDRLNPFRKDNVRIYAKMLTCLPAQNVKSLPALHMLRMEPRAQSRKIAEASSGSTILSLGILARVLWGNEDVEAHVTNKKSVESLNLLRFFGIKPCLYGGLPQQEPTDPTGIMARLRRRAVAASNDMVYLGQYDNHNNWKAHAAWTGPQILRQLPEINVFSTTVGTGANLEFSDEGCIAGTGMYLKSQKPSTTILGVFNALGDPTPGPRYFDGFQSSAFPWQETIDSCVEVSSESAYRMSMRLSREGLICGPSSGEALHGLLQYLAELKRSERLTELVDKQTNEISCVFTCSDLPYQYISGYFERLEPDDFPPIENDVLLQCDQGRHDFRWILDGEQAVELLSAAPNRGSDDEHSPETPIEGHVQRSGLISGVSAYFGCWHGLLRMRKRCVIPRRLHPIHRHTQPNSPTLVLDLRNSNDYEELHIPGSLSAPLPGLFQGLGGGDLFGDAEAVHMLCTRMQKWLQGAQLSRILAEAVRDRRPVILLCYDGLASQLGSSDLRQKGIEAFTVRGGFQALWSRYQKQANA
ncbi:tryptophan synthase beta subunit-like PLP-dependent enzyme [Decorospora gaudefroyi]|uniref:Tryptophan synthase beta subunit-like PLP-dependent enzyme n=1 Tax=Decorospora gaudefroyi TaxID=184978 RepID=A0A6A5JX34_9PLEO|nr:tryptophan synthase beta subunit-like PLP-dependent enzyme [Decorospora gaudefroyi]